LEDEAVGLYLDVSNLTDKEIAYQGTNETSEELEYNIGKTQGSREAIDLFSEDERKGDSRVEMRAGYPCAEDDQHPETKEEASGLRVRGVEEQGEEGGADKFENKDQN
jgi:hypothetical protein